MNNDVEFAGAFCVGVVITFFFFMLAPMKCAKKLHQQQAVDHNAASWVVDQKTGETKFQWKDEVK